MPNSFAHRSHPGHLRRQPRHRPRDRDRARPGRAPTWCCWPRPTHPHPRLPGTVHTAAAEVEAAGGKALAVVGDVRREEDVQRVVDTAVERFGGVDVCVNNASAIATEPTERLSAKKFDLMTDINMTWHVPADPGLPAASARSRPTRMC